MQKKFLTNIFLLLAVNLLIKPFWILGIDRAVQNTIGNEQYGVYANLFAISFVFGLILDFGINNYNATIIAKNKEQLDQSFSGIIGFKLISAFIYILCTMFVGWAYNLTQHELMLLFFLGINQILSFFILYFRSNISGLQLFKTDAFLSIIDRLLMIAFMGYLLWGASTLIKIEHFVFSQTVAYLIAAAISFWVLRPHLKKITITFNPELLLNITKQTYPYAVLGLLMVLYTKVDVLLIKKLVNDTENGIYASANRLLEASNMFAAMIASMLLALFSKNIAQKEELQSIIKTTMAIMIAPAIMLSVFCSIYKVEIMQLLYKNSTSYSADVFGIVILCFIPMCTMYIFGTLLTANGSLRVLNTMAIFTLGINITVNVALIPKYGAFGAAIAALVTQTFFATSNLIYAKKMVHINIHNNQIIQYVLFGVCYLALVYVIKQTQAALVIAAIAISIGGVILLFVFKILSYSSIKYLMAKVLRR